MLVVGLIIGSSIILLRMGFSMVENAREQTLASQFLQSEIETLRLKNWAELSSLPREETFAIESEFDATVADRFTCVRIIEDLRSGANVKQVIIRATWTSTNGVQRELSYMTRIAKDGLNDYYYRSL